MNNALNRKLFPTLKRHIEKLKNIEEFYPSKVKIGDLTVVFEEGVNKLPHVVMEDINDIPLSSILREDFVEQAKKALAYLQIKGLDHLWYGNIIVTHTGSKGSFVDRAYYNPASDIIKFNGYNSARTYTFIHEFGHRHWFKFMSERDRKAFTAYFNTGEVISTTEYGETNVEEDFAEVFTYYVLEKPMNRDQLERFKTFFTMKLGNDEGVARRLSRKVALKFIARNVK